ncbi:hypothetical protein Acor_50680 [Acrocarpospora corrugata]|uniref:Uncharacterized protein n=1 Tax=Acrocarpospora corrugata TaxID=35763 RepID=A0A5M3W4P3_9ACTN|nr:hypothetical protein Acor_50680 [Acrocarpospora corrugata]
MSVGLQDGTRVRIPLAQKGGIMTEKNYWRIRTALEIVKLCLWAVLEVMRGTLP